MIRLWTWISSFFKSKTVHIPEVETRPTHIPQEFKPISLNNLYLPDELKRILREQSDGTRPGPFIGYLREDGFLYDDNGNRL